MTSKTMRLLKINP